MNRLVSIPQVSVNEEEVTVVEWLKADGSQVRSGEAICNVETTKSIVEVSSTDDGFLRQLVAVDERVAIKSPVAVISENAQDDISRYLTPPPKQPTKERRWTRKAALVAKQLGVDLDRLANEHPDKTMTEADIRAAVDAEQPAQDLMDDVHRDGRAERILLLYGAAGGGAIALDSLSRIPHQRAVGILDNNPKSHGKSVMGVKVLGPLDLAESLWNDGFCDAMIILLIDPIEERSRMFDRLRAKGVRFTNIIDPTVDIRSNVKLGVGSLIQPHCYIGPGSSIGDDNFFASHVCIEHHNRVGSHCTFGPRNTTSGLVTIGDKVKTGIGVSFEPYLSVGDETVISSGCSITNDVPVNSSVKAQTTHVVRRQSSNT